MIGHKPEAILRIHHFDHLPLGRLEILSFYDQLYYETDSSFKISHFKVIADSVLLHFQRISLEVGALFLLRWNEILGFVLHWMGYYYLCCFQKIHDFTLLKMNLFQLHLIFSIYF